MIEDGKDYYGLISDKDGHLISFSQKDINIPELRKYRNSGDMLFGTDFVNYLGV